MESRFSSAWQSRAGDSSREMVAEYPMAAAMVAFGVGFGLGIWLGSCLAEETREPVGFAERLGEQILEAVGRVLPESLAGRWDR